MATIANDTQFIGISPTIDLTGKKSAILNEQTIPVTMDDITSTVRPYNVFTALLTQSGGDNPIYGNDEALTIGRTYTITNTDGGTVDFTNVGAPNNNLNTSFIATGENANSWGITNGGQALYNIGAPVATVLENTIGNVWFEYADAGVYFVKCSNITFNQNFTYMTIGNPTWDAGIGFIQSGFDMSTGIIQTRPDFISTTSNCGLLYNTPIEIRVYE